jgi:hypothetical protein
MSGCVSREVQANRAKSLSRTSKSYEWIWKDLLDNIIRVCETYRTGNERQLPAHATKGPTVSQTLSRQLEAAPPIRALIIQPDNSYEVREIEQDIRTLQGLVGGYFETFSTEYCILWFNKHDSEAQPCNAMATYLWWKLCPEMEARGSFCGAVFVTGLADEDTGTETAPVPDEVVELYQRGEQIRQEIEGGA